MVFLWAALLLPAEAKMTVKIGTLAPRGSSWESDLREGFDRIEAESKGEVRFVIYGGGVLGDEADMVRKIRLGALEGGAFASMGVGTIAPEISVLKLPYLFDSLEEVDHIRSKTRARFTRVLEENGFKMLSWTDVGALANIFSTVPISTLEDFKKTKIWLWQGDPVSVEAYKAVGVEGVPLEIPQVFGALKTGLVQTVGGTGLTILALQWYSDLKYITKVNARYEPAFLILKNETWKSLPDTVRKLIEDGVREREPEILRKTRADEKRAFDALVKRGMKVTEPSQEEREKFRELQKPVWELFAGKLYPKELLDLVLAELEKFRAVKAAP